MIHAEPSYNYFLVALSYFIAAFGSYTGLQLVRGIRNAQEGQRGKWIISASFALGGGAVWAMHFIGMIAYDMGMPVVYDPLLTAASLAIAVFVVALGLYLLSIRPNSLAMLLIAGVIAGAGVSSMHYSGMAAMITAADMSYNNTLVIVSVIIGIAAATAAFWLAFNLEGTMQMVGASFVMAFAVCGMHYVGMEAMIMTPNHNLLMPESGVEPLTMGLFIFCFAMIMLVLCLIVTLSQLNKRMYEALEAEDEDDDTEHEGSVRV